MPLLQSNLAHCVIARSEDSPDIPASIGEDLHAFLADAASELGAKQLAAGSSVDHIHLLVSIPPDQALSNVIHEMKTMSERWLQGTVTGCGAFHWANGYTTFSVGISQVRETIAYIQRQTECHRKMNYQQELALFNEALEIGLSTNARD